MRVALLHLTFLLGTERNHGPTTTVADAATAAAAATTKAATTTTPAAATPEEEEWLVTHDCQGVMRDSSGRPGYPRPLFDELRKHALVLRNCVNLTEVPAFPEWLLHDAPAAVPARTVRRGASPSAGFGYFDKTRPWADAPPS